MGDAYAFGRRRQRTYGSPEPESQPVRHNQRADERVVRHRRRGGARHPGEAGRLRFGYAGRMARKKTAVGHDDAAGGGMLQKAARAIGSVVGTLAVTTGIAHAEEPPKMTGKAKRTAPAPL